MPDFRYAQFCPIARVCEQLAERWTLLVVRDLCFGPLRFSDLQRALPGISTSVLAERLAALERRGFVERRELPPPAACTAYALTALGRGLEPVLLELLRFGLRFMSSTRPDDHFEPRWLCMGLAAVARRGPSPPCSIELRVRGEADPIRIRVTGGPQGTQVTRERGSFEAALEGEPRTLLGVAAGFLSPEAALAAGARAEGDLSVLGDLPGLFEMPANDPQP